MKLIQYADKRILICQKPPGVLSVDAPGGMPERIRQELGDEKACVRPVHRLDQAVGGVMVFARSAAADRILSGAVARGEVLKQYLAVVHGGPDAEAGSLEDWLVRDRASRRTYTASPDTPAAKRALLDYEVLARGETLCLLRITLHTGRTHQIRVQLASRDMPIAGDRKYGVPDGYDPIALWSCRLRFHHPETGEVLDFTLPPPAEAPWSDFAPELYR